MPPNDALPTSMDQSFVKSDAKAHWKHVTMQTANAFDNGDHMAVLEHSSPIVDDLQKKLVYLLKMRVVSWSHTANFAQELKEASTLIDYAPRDAAGYLALGCRYADQGYQTRAIQVFEDGLRNVPRTNSQYNKLSAAKQRALSQRRIRIDIMANVPYDVMGAITEQIPDETLRSCLMVSSVWRQRLLAYPGCWRDIHIKKFERFDYFHLPKVYNTLPLICHHIRKLTLPHCPRVTLALKAMTTMNFSSMQSLEIPDPPYGYDCHHYASLCLSLPNIAESLTTLDVSLFIEKPDILSQILKICQKLTALRYCNLTGTNVFTRLALPHRTSLRKVVLEAPLLSFQSSNLVPLFQSSPDIRYMVLRGCGSDIYAAVNEHCPNIKIFWVVNFPYKLSSLDYVDSKRYNGLTNLHMYNPTSTFAIAPLINTHSTSLRTLFISFADSRFGSSEIEWTGNLSSLSLNGLTDLGLESIPDAIASQLPAIIAECPKLKSLGLNMLEGTIPGQTFVAASKLKQLTTLELQEAYMPRSDEKLLLQFLLDARQPQKGKPGLKVLRLYDCGDSSAIVVACSAITTLTELCISSWAILNDRDERSFAAGLGRLPNLEKLDLRNLGLTEQNLLLISENKSLKEVELYNIYDLREEEVRSAFSSSVKLQFEEREVF
ncbi:hypothetical protein BJV82DRAFT_661370 [Fennellomyces sp. T-0311]|nr:hypothetical protein BJV82DRAFT_661370 [Fennellomyces sp. T-0311]